jgi:hypothetical protein
MKQEKLNFWHIPLGMLVAVAVLALMMCSCKNVEYVPVVENHIEHHWHTDSVKERDSTHTERETIIREVDSAAMAKYGIQMERNQRAWLVLQREMEARLRELEQISATKDTVRDSIPVPVPYEVIKEVPAKLSKTQKGLMTLGIMTLMAGVIVGAFWLKKILRL